jgi:hypothetical protein
MELARQIISNLDEKGPLSRRQLARCFRNQRMERFEPVINALIGLGVLVWEADGTLDSGEVEISEVEDRLREALLVPVPADARVPKAATPKPPKPPVQTPPAPPAASRKKAAGKGKNPPGKAPGKSK